jgi:phage shock protein PspC (stress-responsive transcriptional regulator)
MKTWFRTLLDKQVFGICSVIADFLHMKASSVRFFFIYSSFFTLGSPFILYLIIAFLVRLKDLINSNRDSVYES